MVDQSVVVVVVDSVVAAADAAAGVAVVGVGGCFEIGCSPGRSGAETGSSSLMN